MTSQLNVDTIVDKAGSGGTNVKIKGSNSTYVDGTTTQNLVSGVIKAYVCYGTSSTTAIIGSESFNHSSLLDEGTGQTKFTMTNPMSVSVFSLSDSGGDGSIGFSTWVQDNDFSTSTYGFAQGDHDFNIEDGPYHAGQVIGDLA